MRRIRRGAARVPSAPRPEGGRLGTARHPRAIAYGDISAASIRHYGQGAKTVIGMLEAGREQRFVAVSTLPARAAAKRDAASFLAPCPPPADFQAIAFDVLDQTGFSRGVPLDCAIRARVDHARATTPLTRRGAPGARAALADPDVRALPVGRDFEAGVRVA